MAVRVLWLVFGVLLVSALGLTVFLSAQQLASAPSKEEGASKEQIDQEDPKNKGPEDEEVVTEEDQQPKNEASKDSGVSGEPQAPKYYEQPVYEQPTYGGPKNQGAPQW